MIGVKRLPLQVFVSSVSSRYSRTCQHVFDSPTKARLFSLGFIECVFDRLQNRAYAQLVGFSVSTSRARLKILLAWPAPKINWTRPSKKLKHQHLSGLNLRPSETMLPQINLSGLRNSKTSSAIRARRTKPLSSRRLAVEVRPVFSPASPYRSHSELRNCLAYRAPINAPRNLRRGEMPSWRAITKAG
jgi:hypothetical protein